MDIKNVTASSPSASAFNTRPVTESLHVSDDDKTADAVRHAQTEQAVTTHASRVLALGADVRLQLYVDESTNEVYGRVFDRSSGEMLREIPSKELRALRASASGLLKPLVDQVA